jgi:quercetin dioxygenase-like cupin family protein
MPQQTDPNLQAPPASTAPVFFACGVFLDLNKEIARLFADASVKEEKGRKTRMLAKYPEFRMALITMKSGTRWDDHKTPARISVHLLRGRIHFHTPDGGFDLIAGQLLALNPGVIHSVDSLEDSAFLLTLSDVAGK